MLKLGKIGEMVLYTNLGDADGEFPPEQQAAVITGVNEDGTVSLKIFYRTGTFDMQNVAHSHEYKRRHWSYMES